eukprot:6871295-Pyramimonas_sp.AAC.1
MQAFLQHGMIRSIPRVCLKVYRIVHGYVCGVILRLPRLEDFVHAYFATVTSGFSMSDAFRVIHTPVTRVASRVSRCSALASHLAFDSAKCAVGYILDNGRSETVTVDKVLPKLHLVQPLQYASPAGSMLIVSVPDLPHPQVLCCGPLGIGDVEVEVTGPVEHI